MGKESRKKTNKGEKESRERNKNRESEETGKQGKQGEKINREINPQICTLYNIVQYCTVYAGIPWRRIHASY